MRRGTALLPLILVAVFAGLRADEPARSAQAAGQPPFGMQHVVFGKTQLELLTTGAWAPFVHEDRDSFMLMSGNQTGDINCQALNYWAGELRARFPRAPIYAATSGIRNVRNGAPCLEGVLFRGMILVYEPNQENAPEFSWDQGKTSQTFREAASIMRRNGLDAWVKISGRATGGRDQEGVWDYGQLARLVDGQVIQTQASCRDRDGDGNFTNGRGEFNDALSSIHDMYQAAGATSQVSLRVTTSSDDANPNSVSPQDAMQCALAGWAMPEVRHVTLRTGVDRQSIQQATTFYGIREDLIRAQPTSPAAPSAAVAPSVAPAAEGASSGGGPSAEGGAFDPSPADLGVSLAEWQGGGYGQMDASLGAGNSIWIFEEGAAVGYIAGAPDFVNEPFIERYPDGLPAGTLSVVARVR